MIKAGMKVWINRDETEATIIKAEGGWVTLEHKSGRVERMPECLIGNAYDSSDVSNVYAI